ncbi:MAG: hypothetical protein J7L54_05615 [Elusimicrobia bacterium]|nr:hypothetical protein [Elusimicrobiota bacterium]
MSNEVRLFIAEYFGSTCDDLTEIIIMISIRVLRYDFYADCGEVFDVWRVFKKTNPPTSPFTKGGQRGILVAAEGRLRKEEMEKIKWQLEKQSR